MKKFISMMMLACAVAFVGGGCSNDNNGDNVPDITIDPAKPETVASSGGSVTLTLNIDGAEAKSNKDWAKPTVSGKTVTVEVDANPGTTSRNAIITVSKGDKQATVTIKQNASKAPVPAETDINFGAAAEEKTVKVESESEFTATPDATWITATPVEGGVKIAVTANPDKEPRTGKVVLSAGGSEATINVTQIGYNIVPAVTEVNFGYTAGEKEIAVTAAEAFTATASASWITATAKEKSVVIKVAAATADRTGTVTLTMGTLKADITITQSRPSYNDYIGTWTVKSATVTFQTVIAQKSDTTYTSTGWGESGAAQNMPITLKYDVATGALQVLPENLGKITITDVGETDYLFSGYGPYGQGLTVVAPSDGFFIMSGVNAGGTVEFEAETVNLDAPGTPELTFTGCARYVVIEGKIKMLQGDYEKIDLPITMTKESSNVPEMAMGTGIVPMNSVAKSVGYSSYHIGR